MQRSVHIATGTYRQDRHGGGMAPAVGKPEPRAQLDDKGRQLWQDIISGMPPGYLGQIDSALFPLSISFSSTKAYCHQIEAIPIKIETQVKRQRPKNQNAEYLQRKHHYGEPPNRSAKVLAVCNETNGLYSQVVEVHQYNQRTAKADPNGCTRGDHARNEAQEINGQQKDKQ